MLRNMKICRVLLHLRSLSKNCLVFVFPESTVRWTGKNWKAWSVLQRQGKRKVSGQTWAVSTAWPMGSMRAMGGSFHWEMKCLLCISVMNDVRMSMFMCIVFFLLVQFSWVQLLSCVQLFVTPWTAAYLSITNTQSPSQWCHPTISPSVVPFSSFPQSFPASGSF